MELVMAPIAALAVELSFGIVALGVARRAPVLMLVSWHCAKIGKTPPSLGIANRTSTRCAVAIGKWLRS